MVSHEPTFSINTLVDLSQALIPFENRLSAILDLLRFVSASLQTLCVRQSLNGCLSVDDISIAANRYCWDSVSREHWKHLNCHIEKIPSQLPPTMVHAGIYGKDGLHFFSRLKEKKKKEKKIHLTFL